MSQTADQKVTISYEAGICNIGSEGAAYRRKSGYVGFGLGMILAAIGIYFEWNSGLLALLAFFPFAIGALGFLQARNMFCVDYGLKGEQNVNDKTSGVSITELADKLKDKKKSQSMIIQAVSIAAILSLLVSLV